MGGILIRGARRWAHTIIRGFSLPRAPVIPLEPYRAQPRGYRLWSVSIVLALTIGLSFGLRFMEPRAAALVAAILVAHAALVPAVRTPAGGTLTFPTVILLTTAFLYNPSTVFVGVTIGWTFGHTVFHRRELWRGTSNALILALGASGGALVVGLLRAHLTLPAVIAVAPLILLAVNRLTNVALLALLANVRWSMAPWSYFIARIRGSIPDQFLDIIWLLPVILGSILLPPAWWWALLVISLPISAIDARCTTRNHGWKNVGDAPISDTLARIDDPRFQALTTHLSQGTALIDPSGCIFLITRAALSLCGLRRTEPDSRLHDLFAESDKPLIARLLTEACGGHVPRVAELRPRASPDRILFLNLANRLADPRLRGFAITLQEAPDENRRWRALLQYADRTFAAPLVRALEDERCRVGQEVDSSIRQTLALLQLALDRPGRESSPTPQILLHQAMTAARSVQRMLAPPELHDLGLLASIRTYARDMQANGLEIEIQTTLSEYARFDPYLELVAYRAVHWAIDNVARHAGVKHATVQLSSSSDGLRVVVVDSGRGFQVDRTRRIGGLLQIEGRVSLVGGTVTIESEPGRGTRVIVNLPVNPEPVTAQRTGT